ncbi:serine/threonine protein kinase [Paeniglutamicibacter sp. ORCA_105]|uniref:serine/threonine protein kinase n=1 Tax=Paeniglutamicibacter sp. ORCA_105 TaxID=3377336 RepID=UPI0038965658
MESQKEPPPFPRIDGYRTLRHLDEGSGGSIWVVQDGTTHEELVVKILLNDAPGSAVEAEVLRLDHEFLVESFGMIETSLGPGVLMEYCPAGSVAQIVAVRGPLNVGETITVMAPIAEALAFLHARGLTHGDLSPRNILFTAAGKPKLGDFGTHRVVGETPGEYGTQGFCAPETCSGAGAGELQPARDVYALAACAWYLLTGRPPNATARRVPLGAMVPEVNDEFAKLLEQGLDPDPEVRPSAAQFGQRIFVAGTPEAVELSAAIEPDALKHMLTTRQTPAAKGLLGRGRRTGNPTAADKVMLKERKAQIKAQQKPVPRRLRAVFEVKAGPEEQTESAGGEQRWAQQHRIHGLKRGNRNLAAAAAMGLLVVSMAAVTTSMLKQTNEMAIAGPPQAQVDAAPPAAARAGETDLEEAPETRRELVLVAAELSARRDRGLMDGSLEELSKVHVVGSPALAVDAKVVARMQDLGLRLEALKTRLNEVSVLPGENALEATIEATSVQSGYRYVDRKGVVIASAKKSESQRVRMVLRFVDGSWRMWQVTGSK